MLHGAGAGRPMCHAAFVICRGIQEHTEALTLQKYVLPLVCPSLFHKSFDRLPEKIGTPYRYRNLPHARAHYTEVLHFHLHPSATMVPFTGFVGHVCPPFGHTCPTRLLSSQPFFVRPLPSLPSPWWLKGEGGNAKPLCNARARVDTIIKGHHSDRETKRPRFDLIARANAS